MTPSDTTVRLDIWLDVACLYRTRSEAQRLMILPHSFEEMEKNKDGVVNRAEYERAFTH